MNRGEATQRILDVIENNDFRGYDPYDALNSPLLDKTPSRILKLAFTQLFVYSPLNLRPLFGVKKGVNPKSLGLVLRAYCNLYRSKMMGFDELVRKADHVDSLLNDLSSGGRKGNCWGFNFPWQDLTRYSKPYLPTVVVTATVANAYLDLYEITGRDEHLKKAESSCRFITEDLNRYENKHGICFSYTPIDRNVVHNASLLGAEILSRVSSKTGNEEYAKLAEKAVDFSLAYQREDGSWPYSMRPEDGFERMQIDFHQGFVLDSLIRICEELELGIGNSIRKGARFYLKKQFDDGLTLWRYPGRSPVDIHHQAQGVITSARLFHLWGDEWYRTSHQRILERLMDTFILEDGKVLFQKSIIKNRIQYTRWSLSWALLALSYSLPKK